MGSGCRPAPLTQVNSAFSLLPDISRQLVKEISSRHLLNTVDGHGIMLQGLLRSLVGHDEPDALDPGFGVLQYYFFPSRTKLIPLPDIK